MRSRAAGDDARACRPRAHRELQRERAAVRGGPRDQSHARRHQSPRHRDRGRQRRRHSGASRRCAGWMRLQQYARSLPGVGAATSIVDFIKQLNRAVEGGSAASYVIPDDEESHRAADADLPGFRAAHGVPIADRFLGPDCADPDLGARRSLERATASGAGDAALHRARVWQRAGDGDAHRSRDARLRMGAVGRVRSCAQRAGLDAERAADVHRHLPLVP